MTNRHDTPALEQGIAGLRDASEWPDGVVDALRQLIVSGPDSSVFHVNPLAYAGECGIEESVAIDLFIHATALGLMRIEWSLLCRGCGELVATLGRLGDLGKDFFCYTCARERPSNLDEFIEIGFTIAPEIRSIRHHDLASLTLDEYFFEHSLSRSILVKDDDASLVDFIRARALALLELPPRESKTWEATLEKGWVVGNPRVMITIEGEPTDEVQELHLKHEDRAFNPRPELRPGPVRVVLENATDEPLRVLQYFTPIVTYFEYAPFLTGQSLLNNATFRRVLRTEVVQPGDGVPLTDNVLLFTDLYGSTALYSRVGDDAAFELVTAHFECVARVVTRCSGAVVKTMGDAVMASFSRPADAVRAAMAMGEELAGLGSRDAEGQHLRPKIGIHRGPCIAVSINDTLDYFGQTVNVAARLQAEAGADELCISATVRDDPEVPALLEQWGGATHERVRLKGVEGETEIYRAKRP